MQLKTAYSIGASSLDMWIYRDGSIEIETKEEGYLTRTDSCVCLGLPFHTDSRLQPVTARHGQEDRRAVLMGHHFWISSMQQEDKKIIPTDNIRVAASL